MSSRFAAGGLAVLFAAGVFGQSKGPSFEVASVKPATDVSAISITPERSGDRITYVTSLEPLVCYAFRVQPFQISGELTPGIFDIDARMAGSPSDEQVRQMLQTLLADRFHFKFHRQTKEMRGYELVVDRRGSKLKAAQEGNAVTFDGGPAPAGANAFFSNTGPRLLGKEATMGQLAETLGKLLKAPVTDKTAIQGKYDFDVRFKLEGMPAGAGDMAPAPLLPAALEESLGLRLAPGKAPLEMLVVDHVERPSEN